MILAAANVHSDIAQLVEYLIVNQGVLGSSPSVGATQSPLDYPFHSE